MSGYGMPQGPTPGSPRSGRNAPALPVLELVGVGLAVLAFVVAFLPWAKPQVPGVDADSVNGWTWRCRRSRPRCCWSPPCWWRHRC